MQISRLGLLLALAVTAAPVLGCQAQKKAPPETAVSSSSGGPSSNTGGRNSMTVPSAETLETLRSNFKKVHFDFDKATLAAEARDALEANAALLIQHSEVHVMVEGHTDHFGSDEYNLALGQQRAESVHRFLLDLGVSAGKLTLISYGREKTVVAAGSKDSEAPNRRAEFVVVAGGTVAGSSTEEPGVEVTLQIGE